MLLNTMFNVSIKWTTSKYVANEHRLNIYVESLKLVFHNFN